MASSGNTADASDTHLCPTCDSVDAAYHSQRCDHLDIKSQGLDHQLLAWDVRDTSKPMLKIPVNHGAVLKVAAAATSGQVSS